jgi:hypothetical protein
MFYLEKSGNPDVDYVRTPTTPSGVFHNFQADPFQLQFVIYEFLIFREKSILA